MATDKRQRQRANRQLRDQQQQQQTQRGKLTRRLVIGVVAVVGGLAAVLLLAWAFGGDDGDDESSAIDFDVGTGDCPPEDGVDEPVRRFEDAPQLCIDPDADYTARFVTSEGDIVVDLDTETTPGTVNNFVTLARYGTYDDTLIFRTEPSIDIIQGGGRSNTEDIGYTIPDEGSGFSYPPGVIAMANTGQPNSGGAQWFFTLGPNSAGLSDVGNYVVFGQITEGLEVAEAILALAPEEGDAPTREVTVETVEITQV